MKSCASCKFYRAKEGKEQYDYCVYNPPAITNVPEYTKQGGELQLVWITRSLCPPIYDPVNFYCGKYKRKWF